MRIAFGFFPPLAFWKCESSGDQCASHGVAQAATHNPIFHRGKPGFAPQHRNVVLAFSRRNASVCADSIAGQRILILHGVPRPGVSEKAKPRLFGSILDTPFFNVSQGKFGLLWLQVFIACCCIQNWGPPWLCDATWIKRKAGKKTPQVISFFTFRFLQRVTCSQQKKLSWK